MQTESKKLGETLVKRKIITPEQLEKALELQQDSGQRVDKVLVEQGTVTPADMATAVSLYLGIPFINLVQRKPQQQATALIPKALARKHSVLPVELVGNRLVLAMADPLDKLAYQDVQDVSGKIIEPVVAVKNDIRQWIDQNYDHSVKSKTGTEQTYGFQPRHIATPAMERIDESSVGQFIDALVSEAIQKRASDIHIEPQKDRLRIRYRIDGVLHDVKSLPLDIHPRIISRLKILAKMNITERRQPQDGHFSVKDEGNDVDVRVATYDTACGEMTVLRLLNRAFSLFELDELGFNPLTLERYEHMLEAPFGMIIVIGPTGSGKTTTLYASVNHLRRDERNILTVEDPIEYEFDGVNQGQVNVRAGLTFASSLRAMLRLDPDIIVVGEIRDRETAQMAVQIALTGRLVLSSMHANDAARALFRLLDLGVEPSLISSSVIGVVSQRIVRRVCRHCCRLTRASPEAQLTYWEEFGQKRTRFLYGTGCDFCANTGYFGRVGLFEVMLLSDEIQRMLMQGASPKEIETQAVQEGMITMRKDGMIKVKEGITTPSEVNKAVFSVQQF